MRAVLLIAVLLILAFGRSPITPVSVAGASTRTPVLGSKLYDPPYAEGYGDYKPRNLSNGGSPSADIYGIAWKGWGQRLPSASERLPSSCHKAATTGSQHVPSCGPRILEAVDPMDLWHIADSTNGLSRSSVGPSDPGVALSTCASARTRRPLHRPGSGADAVGHRQSSQPAISGLLFQSLGAEGSEQT